MHHAQVRGRILLVEDDGVLAGALAVGLRAEGFEVTTAASAEGALQVLNEESFDVVVSDLHLGGMNGLELCAHMAERVPGTPLIVMTGFGSFETAVQAVRAGAYDFLSKPVDVDVLTISVERALERSRLIQEVRVLRDRVDQRRGFAGILGDSPAMQRIYDLLERAAPSDATVLVTGASGTGKELIARALHRRSKRSSGPFVAINCGAMPEPLLESELFGHAKGAFTGASVDKRGLLLEANGGTLFLDEVGEMPAPMQVKLLRALQERTVRPVGGTHEQAVDVRIIAATNRDLEQEIEEHRFREDLYFRLAVIVVELPGLAERGSDVLLLAQHFVEKAAQDEARPVLGFAPDAARLLQAYDWPGNVRELQNAVDRAVALTRHDHITADDLPPRMRRYSPTEVVIEAQSAADLLPLAEIERRYVLRALALTGDNRTRAAKLLGVDRKTLRRKIEPPKQDS